MATSVEPRPAEVVHDPDEVIRTEQLTKVYPGDIKAVDGLDLSVRRGEIFGLLGPNGAGKTTTAGMLTTRVIPTGGRAYVGGVDVVAHPTAAKQVIGVVPQTNTLDRSLTVWENLYFHGRFFGMNAKTSKAEATRLLEQFRLAERATAPVLALSGGMAQRLMVARAIMHKPAILFLDEPTAGLDPQSRIALWDILGELHGAGQTILLTTHYMEEADELCNRLAIIDRGKLLALDTPAALKQSVGIDAMVTVTADGDLDQLATVLRDRDPERDDRRALRRRRAHGRARHQGRAARRSSTRPSATASPSPTSRPPNPHSKRCSSTSPGRTSANDRHHRDRRRSRASRSSSDRRASPRAPRSARSSSATSPCCASPSRSSCRARLLQPFLLVFVFTYVFPKIGQGVGGSGAAAAEFSTRLVAGVIGLSIMFQGIQSVALPMVQEFGYTREIEDRVLAPMPVALVAIEKVISGAFNGLFAALLVFPIAAIVPATPVHLAHQLAGPAHARAARLLHVRRARPHVRDPVRPPDRADALRNRRAAAHVPRCHLLLVVVARARSPGSRSSCWRTRSSTCARGSGPRSRPSEHMSLWAVYPVMIGFSVLFTWLGISGFKKRVLS